MKTTGIFTTHSYTIPFRKWGEPIYLLPFGDVHRSSPMHAADHWREWLDDAKSLKGAWFFGMGDYLDIASTSERTILRDNGLHEATVSLLEDVYLSEVERLCKELRFMKGRLIGLIEGNHYGQFSNGTTTTQKMCEILECQYLGVCTFTRLNLFHTGDPRNMPVKVWAHHGAGAARMLGGSLNRVQQMAEAADADIYLMGHDHKINIGKADRLYLTDTDPPVVDHRTRVFMRTGGFLRGYVAGKSSYIADSMFPPTTLGCGRVELKPTRYTVDSVRLRSVRIKAAA